VAKLGRAAAGSLAVNAPMALYCWGLMVRFHYLSQATNLSGCVTGSRRFSPPNHATGFEDFFQPQLAGFPAGYIFLSR
jgi:hypothetical protein